MSDCFFDSKFIRSALTGLRSIINEEKYGLLRRVPVDVEFSIDSRNLLSGQVFVALIGAQCDGHDFLQEAIEKGAVGLIIHESKQKDFDCLSAQLKKKVFVVVVSDPLRALVDLARAWRNKFTYPVVGITGSVGKTTTKEMLRTIFSRAKILACFSYKNQNTLIGVCLNILKMRVGHKAAIFEVGISERNEIDENVALLRPTIGLITTIAHSHLEGLGTLHDIAKEKMKLLVETSGTGIICGDCSLLDDASYSLPIIRFGFSKKNQIQARRVSTRRVSTSKFTLKIHEESRDVSLYINHRGSVYNSLAASSIAHLLGFSIDQIVDGLEHYKGFEGRLERRRLKNGAGWLIDDCYNASPESMKAALLAVEEMDLRGEKIAVLGDMLELGDREVFWHRQIGRVLSKTRSISQIVLVGERAKNIASTAPATISFSYASDWKEAAGILEKKIISGESLVLVKGSLAISLGKLVFQVCL